MSNEIKIPKNPLERIALSCSGGGYRAASFHFRDYGLPVPSCTKVCDFDPIYIEI